MEDLAVTARARKQTLGKLALLVGIPSAVASAVGLFTVNAHTGSSVLCCGAPIVAVLSIPFGAWMLWPDSPSSGRRDTDSSGT